MRHTQTPPKTWAFIHDAPHRTEHAQRLHRSLSKLCAMLMFTAEGPRSIDDRDVIAVYRENALGGYCNATVVLIGGEEVSGRCLVAAIDRIEREIADSLLPPAA
jgi:hypothetical protein